MLFDTILLPLETACLGATALPRDSLSTAPLSFLQQFALGTLTCPPLYSLIPCRHHDFCKRLVLCSFPQLSLGDGLFIDGRGLKLCRCPHPCTRYYCSLRRGASLCLFGVHSLFHCTHIYFLVPMSFHERKVCVRSSVTFPTSFQFCV